MLCMDVMALGHYLVWTRQGSSYVVTGIVYAHRKRKPVN